MSWVLDLTAQPMASAILWCHKRIIVLGALDTMGALKVQSTPPCSCDPLQRHHVSVSWHSSGRAAVVAYTSCHLSIESIIVSFVFFLFDSHRATWIYGTWLAGGCVFPSGASSLALPHII